MNSIELQGLNALERGFALRWATLPNAPRLLPQYRFHSARKWRFDFAHPESRVGVEIDGGTWMGGKGGHTSGIGMARDREKDFEAIMDDWVVIRLTPEMAKDRSRLERIAQLMRVRLTPERVEMFKREIMAS